MTDPNQNTKKRPDLLIVTCVLTFIGSGFSALVNGLAYLTADTWEVAVENGALEVFQGRIEMEAVKILLEVDPTYFLLQTILFSLSFYGALLMWKFKKIGFHIYTVVQILLLIVSKVYIPGLPFPLIPLLLSATFVLLYARNLQLMR